MGLGWSPTLGFNAARLDNRRTAGNGDHVIATDQGTLDMKEKADVRP